MNFSFSEEQLELRNAVRKFLEDKCSIKEVRALMETSKGYDESVWQQACSQLGLASLIIPEKFGGSGFSYVELLIVFEELGRTLACLPFFSSIALGANALLAVGDENANKEYLPRIATGESIATLAFTEDLGSHDTSTFQTNATQNGSDTVINGHKSFVVDGHIADLLLVVAKNESGLGLYAVLSEEGVNREQLETMDQTRKQARIEFSNTPVRLIGKADSSREISKALDLAAILLAAEQVGGSQVCLDMSVEYAKNRIQFGRPIGSFQAIKHKCAEMLMELESARSAAYYAAWEAADDSEEIPVLASMAKAYCSDAYFHIAGENIQIHGGIGFTWEHDAHLYFKRAKSTELLLGSPTYHRELLAQRLGI